MRWVAPLLAFGVRIVNGPLTVDDAYITFRYARNIAEGIGFTYNSGEAVLGTTTPLWALTLAALHWTTRIELPWLAMGLNGLFDAASAGVLFLVLQRLGATNVAALAACLLFATAPMSVAYAAGGMEASLFVLLLCLAGLLATKGRLVASAALAGLATLARPEGALAGLLLLGLAARRERRLPVASLAAYLAPLAPWLLFATLTFGSPLPQSLAAKSAAYQASPAVNALALALQPGLPGLNLLLLADQPDLAPAMAVLALAASAGLALFAARAAIGAWRRLAPGRAALPCAILRQAQDERLGGLRQAPDERLGAMPQPAHNQPVDKAVEVALTFALYPVMYVLAYSAAGLRGVRMFHWYLAPLVPFYCTLLALAAQRLGSSRLLVGRSWIAFAALAVWWLPSYQVLSAHPTLPRGFSTARERLYSQVAADYRTRWENGAVVAAPEIGALGYHSRARILDTVGLVSPQAVPFSSLPAELLASDNAVSPALIRHARPEYVVSLDQFVRRSLLPDPWFRQSYELVESRPARIWDSEQLLVFRRTDVGF